MILPGSLRPYEGSGGKFYDCQARDYVALYPGMFGKFNKKKQSKGKARQNGASARSGGRRKHQASSHRIPPGQSLDITLNDAGMLRGVSTEAGAMGSADRIPQASASPLATGQAGAAALAMSSRSRTSSLTGSKQGVQRSAKLLLALGPDQAAKILQQMEAPEIEKLMSEMLRIESIPAAEKKEILADFQTTVEDFEEPVRGGLEETKKILELGLGQDRAQEMLNRINQRDFYRDFEFLERMDPAMLASTLSQEHTQIAAVALSFLKPRIAAQVMCAMSPEARSEVATRLARTARIQPDAVQRVAQVLRDKFEKKQQEVFSEVGGADNLANILNHMDRTHEDEILGVLGENEPEILNDVRERLYTFEELINLTLREMRQLIARVNDDIMLATALRGAADDMRRHFFNAMSHNRAADILDEMERRGPISVKEINEARAYILNIARHLDEEGAVVIKKTKEEYI